MKQVSRNIYKIGSALRNRLYRMTKMRLIKSSMADCGSNVIISQGCRIAGIENFSFGHDIYIGPGAILYSTRAKLILGNYINFGPNVSIITGDHRIDVVGKYMKEITDADKLDKNDLDVVIEDDVWIGAGAIILKGVTIGTGSVISAGAIVRRDVEPYTIYYSEDSQRKRFDSETIRKHEELLKDRL